MSHPPTLPAPFPALFEALERSSDPVFITDRNNHVASWNEAATRLLGYGREESLGQACAGLMLGCDASGNRYCTDHCAIREMGERDETIRQFNIVLTAKDRTQISVDVTIMRFEAPSPHQFFLAHILKPTRASTSAEAPRNGGSEPLPRTARQAAQDSEDARARRLTQREVEILGMLAAGRATAQIADALHISTLTARNHIQNVLDKLEVHSKAEAVAFAFQKRLF